MRRSLLLAFVLALSCSDDSGGKAVPEAGAPAEAGSEGGGPAGSRLERPTDLLPRPPGDRLPPDLFPPTGP
jgi:hypothetical protein